MPTDALLSARVTKDVQDAYSLVQDHYEVNQSDLIRMAPLLLVLLAESNFKDRRKEIAEVEESLCGNPSAAEMLKLYRDNHLKIRSPRFVEYLREIAEDLDVHGKAAVSSDDIDLQKDNLPGYRLFRETHRAQHEFIEQEKLKEVAANAAEQLVHDPSSIPQNESTTIPPQYDGPLLAMAKSRLGKLLDEEQKINLRQFFKKAVHSSASTNVQKSDSDILADVAQHIAYNLIPADQIPQLAQMGEGYIPQEYDGRLLAIARTQLGKFLTEDQKIKLRQLLKERIADRDNGSIDITV
ncbi:MAG: hypothetical protein OXE84_12010 [Rhodobacteraceae bacterium]|nr:hypothetical protein [Paracoccaceae bacterium]MCY4196285.1 hypothetical protein [Paracoccaceae bacterium]MCY4327494.1 hypothetical protein [Paracoccaceae bacterium]